MERKWCPLPPDTAHGALLAHLTDAFSDNFQPMNINFGLFPPIKNMTKNLKGRDKKAAYARRALASMEKFLGIII